jgi:hypothetical protein
VTRFEDPLSKFNKFERFHLNIRYTRILCFNKRSLSLRKAKGELDN